MEYKIDYKKKLNPAQYEAVMANNGPVLVIAGAGSGKTRTLTYRVARLVEDGILPQSILLLTFTRKASQEMLTRAASLLDNRCAIVAGGTFHSFATGILRRYAPHVGFENGFTILDRDDSETLIEMIRKDWNLNTAQRNFPKKATIAGMFGKAVNKSVLLAKVIENEFAHFEHETEVLVKMYAEYDALKKKQNSMDYDDLLVYFKKLLDTQPEIRKRLSSTYQYIMVDEYQDTNPIQADIVYLLAQQHNNVMVVGDDSQSIYAFRGANFKNILRFPDIFPNTKIIKLEENYRSIQPILSLTNTLIAQAKEKFSKTLFSKREKGKEPTLIITSSENLQSRFVVEMIPKLIKNKNIHLKDIAVLFRAGYHTFDLELELTSARIPYVKYGGFKFMESAHIKSVVAFLRVIDNPYDRISWYRVLTLHDKIGQKGAETIVDELFELKQGYNGLSNIKKKQNELEGLKKLFAQIDLIKNSVKQIGEAVIRYYKPIMEKTYDDHPKRMRDLDQLLEIIEKYDDIAKLLEILALEPPSNSVNDNLCTDDAQDRLILSTVHSAKGLEWDTVFIIWALDGRFPSIYALNHPDELEEELRLMYVAATRAKNKLFFVCPVGIYDRSTGMVLNDPCRFLDCLPRDVIQIKHLRE